MELVFGAQVRSAGRRLGYLAGLEVDATSRTVTKVVFSDDGKLGPHAHTRPLAAVHVERGSLVIGDAASSVSSATRLLWTRSTRIVRDGRETGRLAGAAVGDEGTIESVLARQHWWKRRQRLPAAELDFATPGEIRRKASGTLAA